MRIVQITDIHIGRVDEFPHQVDCRAQFLSVLNAVEKLGADQIVLSGDLCFKDPESEAYAWIADQLTSLDQDVHIIAGNHDSQRVMSKHFDVPYRAETNEIYFKTRWCGSTVLFLDTARGVMSDTQYTWLEEVLADSDDRVIIFMHHPPLYCGVPHMDGQYAFREIPRVQKILDRSSASKAIFCGHYHVEREIQLPGQTIHITPSTFFQIDARETDFAIDHHRPGYRVIDLTDVDLQTWCGYAEESR